MTAYIVLQLTSTISKKECTTLSTVRCHGDWGRTLSNWHIKDNTIYSAGCLIPGTTTGALHYISNSADRNHGYDKEDGDEPHSLLQNELRHRTTFPAMHRVGC